jgi:hypothetical protein
MYGQEGYEGGGVCAENHHGDNISRDAHNPAGVRLGSCVMTCRWDDRYNNRRNTSQWTRNGGGPSTPFCCIISGTSTCVTPATALRKRFSVAFSCKMKILELSYRDGRWMELSNGGIWYQRRWFCGF